MVETSRGEVLVALCGGESSVAPLVAFSPLVAPCASVPLVAPCGGEICAGVDESAGVVEGATEGPSRAGNGCGEGVASVSSARAHV